MRYYSRIGASGLSGWGCRFRGTHWSAARFIAIFEAMPNSLHFPRKLTADEIELNIELPDTFDARTEKAPAGAAGTDDKSWAVVGQTRAVKALEMGVAIRAKGYNIFVVGESGTGKHTAILDVLSRRPGGTGSLRDIAYVQDYTEPDKPISLTFPQGMARKFRDDLALLLERLTDRIGRDMDSESYKAERDALIAEAESGENKILAEFEARLKADGFRTVQTEDDETGRAADIAPVIDGEAVLFDDLQERVSSGGISETMWTEARERYFSHMDAMKRIYRELRTAREALAKQLNILKTRTVKPGIREEFAAAGEQWAQEGENDGTAAFLAAMEADVLEHADWFAAEDEDDEVDLSIRYGVNIVVDRHGIRDVPVIHETNPTRINLFGAVNAHSDASGEMRTNLMMIKAGSLLRADGGFLILQAEDVFSKDDLWPELKRALQTGHVVPEVQTTPLGPLPILMKPAPVSTETTVILVGPVRIYESLCEGDDEFLKLFKVTAEFSSVMKRSPEAERRYALFAAGLAAKEKLRPMNTEGIREIVSYGVRLAERRDRLSTRFGLIGDLIRESDYAAAEAGREVIDAGIVREAAAAREYLGSLAEEMLIEQIRDETLIIDVAGRKVGAVNGLAVLERGSYSFGTPLRITASVGPGKEGLINIERESGLSGELHDKGVFLLEGFLRHRYARRQAPAFTAGIAVEQSHYEIDGDSASAAELAALLSALAELPLRQDIAVTGAVDQEGILQPVGGIYEKVQGFFRACDAKGLTGGQGVVVPAGSIASVILSDRVTAAVKEGRFHLWAAKNIDHVMAILSGSAPGRQRRNGRFDRGSVNERVRRGLEELADAS